MKLLLLLRFQLLLLEDEDLDAEEAVLEVEEVGECTNRSKYL